MSNMNKKTHDMLYPVIIENIGGMEICCNPNCNATPFDLEHSGRDSKLLIDHIDNNNNNNAINNLQLLCRSCNTKKNHPRKIEEPVNRNAPPEFMAGKKNYKKAKAYIYGRLLEPESNGVLNLEEIIDDTSNYVDCTQTQVKNYIKKMCSKRHGSTTTEERKGDWFLVFKTDTEMEYVMKKFNEGE